MCASLQSPEACIRTEGSVPSANFLQSPRALSDHDSIPSLDSGSRPSATSTPTHPSPHLRNVRLISIPTLVSCQKATFSASVAMGHRKPPQEDRGTWTPRWLLQLSTPCVHLDGFPAPLAGAPTQPPVPDNLLPVSLLGTCPHLSLHKVIS